MRNRGFTLIELLVVIAVIAILAAIMFPVFSTAKGTAQKASCASNMKQTGTALMMYTQDHNDSFSHCTYKAGSYTVSAHDWGKWFWMFTARPYISNKPADFNQGTPSSNIFVCPSRPVYHALTRTGQIYALYAGLAQEWGLTYGKVTDRAGKSVNGYAMWCSYTINEHIPYSSWKLRMWESPSSSFLLFEGKDTEMTGDQLYDKFNYNAHRGGTNIVYMDGHVKWSKSDYSGVPTQRSTVWNFPPGGPDGGLPNSNGEGGDLGPWTASSLDD